MLVTLAEHEEVDRRAQGIGAGEDPEPGERGAEAQAASDQGEQNQDAQLEREERGVETQAPQERGGRPRRTPPAPRTAR